MIVVDASAALAWLHGDEPWGRQVAERLRGERVYAPELLDLEVLSALRRFVRAGLTSAEDAQRALVTLSRLAIERMSHREVLARVWELRDNLTAYDASYVALAESLEIPLLTTDTRLARAPGIRCQIELIS